MNVASLSGKFAQHFNHYPQAAFFAPGRVNLMGEHTDYNQGLVLAATIDKGCYLLIALRSDQTINVVSESFPDEPRQWQSSALIPQDNEFDWSNYLRLLNEQLTQHGAIRGMDVYIASDLPMGAGLSSSFALLVAFAEAVNQLNQLKLSPLTIAQVCLQTKHQLSAPVAQLSEPLAIASGMAKQALLIDCRNDKIKAVALPEDLVFLIVDLKQPKGFVASAFLQRKTQCATAANAFGLTSLRELAVEDLMAAKRTLDEVVYKRALHVVTENARAVKMAECLLKNDIAQVSKLLAESQRSLKEDLDVTTENIDFIARELQSVLGSEGGVHLTGGGFGGSLLVLARPAKVDLIQKKIQALFGSVSELKPSVYPVAIADGVRRLELNATALR